MNIDMFMILIGLALIIIFCLILAVLTENYDFPQSPKIKEIKKMKKISILMSCTGFIIFIIGLVIGISNIEQ